MNKVLEDSIPITAPFDAIAGMYDDSFSNSSIGRVQRSLVWTETDRTFQPGQRILEVNCGTGIDALHLATRGVQVIACDSAPRMIGVARRRLEASSFRFAVELRCISTEQIGLLEDEGPYDGVFSNFAGLNCLSDLNPVARDISRLVKPGGKVILCLFGPLCLWEVMYYGLGCDFVRAFRRLRGATIATLAPGTEIAVRYPTVRQLAQVFSPHFRLERWRGVGITVPPSYLESLAVSFPRLFRLAVHLDARLGYCPGFRALADHIVLIFERSHS